MREILSFHVGQAGIQIGNTAWELLCLEHGIQPDGSAATNSSNLQVLFSESQTKANVPRAAFFDDDPLTINSINKGPLKKVLNQNLIKLFKTDQSLGPSNQISDYDKNNTSSRTAEEIIRKMLESADAASAIIIYHSLAGGFGSGFTCKLLEMLNDETAKSTKLTVSIFPSSNPNSQFTQPVVEPYNTMLTLPTLAEMSDFNILYDNAAMYRVCQNQLDFETPNYNHINYMIAQSISSITQSIRFRGSKFVDFNDMRNSLITTPRQQFLWSSYSPFIQTDQQNLKKPNLQDITESLFNDSGPLLSFNRLTHRYLASSLFFKGDCPLPELNYVMKQIKQSESIRFAEGTQIAYQTSVSNAQPYTLPNYPFAKYNKAACMLAHSTGVLKNFQQLDKRFNSIYTKRAFVHWFVGQGLEEGRFSEQAQALQQIIELYKGQHGDGKPVEVQPKSDRKQEYGYKKEQQPKQQVQTKKKQDPVQVKQKYEQLSSRQQQDSIQVKNNQDQAPKTRKVQQNNSNEDAYDERAPAKVQQKPQAISTNNQKQSDTIKSNRISQQQEDNNIEVQQQDDEDVPKLSNPQQQNNGLVQSNNQQKQQENQQVDQQNDQQEPQLQEVDLNKYNDNENENENGNEEEQ